MIGSLIHCLKFASYLLFHNFIWGLKHTWSTNIVHCRPLIYLLNCFHGLCFIWLPMLIVFVRIGLPLISITILCRMTVSVTLNVECSQFTHNSPVIQAVLLFVVLCKDCGINAHRHCKDLVVMECRKHASCHGRVLIANGQSPIFSYLPDLIFNTVRCCKMFLSVPATLPYCVKVAKPWTSIDLRTIHYG